jgi:hypothetical protein
MLSTLILAVGKKVGSGNGLMTHYVVKFALMLKKNEEPRVAIVDSQSVKTVQKGSQRGYDAGKKTKGRKRHIAVDTLGLLLIVVVHAASIQDRVGARAVFIKLARYFQVIQTIFVDGGYTGKVNRLGFSNVWMGCNCC